MAKKISFDNLPRAVEKILETLAAGGSEHSALPELVQRMALLEKKFDNLERLVSPNRPVMDKQTVLRVLKLRPKVVSELERTGVLPSHSEGRRTLFYEDDVVRFYMNQGAWKSVVSSAAGSGSVSDEGVDSEAAASAVSEGGRKRVGAKEASVILNRSAAAVYQLTASGRVPFHKDGAKVFFYTDELREWLKGHPARPRVKK
ncbi:MAG: helix-turn-helix domain-containing protein [Alistipes sp.]|jgi:excisionase family DNA binding protein|nr:helix-turn-helix domain-containing protein [Alistipes sp.]